MDQLLSLGERFSWGLFALQAKKQHVICLLFFFSFISYPSHIWGNWKYHDEEKTVLGGLWLEGLKIAHWDPGASQDWPQRSGSRQQAVSTHTLGGHQQTYWNLRNETVQISVQKVVFDNTITAKIGHNIQIGQCLILVLPLKLIF